MRCEILNEFILVQLIVQNTYWIKFVIQCFNVLEKTGRALFSPRMEYNEWLPVGRGDPLKDPTYDYVPPVLDRVRYWADGASQKDNTDILLLGVPSKKLTNKQKEKTQYGPIRRNYYSQQYVAPTQPRQEVN